MAIVNYGEIINPPKPYIFTQDVFCFEKPSNANDSLSNFPLYKNKTKMEYRDVVRYKNEPHQYFLSKEKKIIVSTPENNIYSFFTDVFFPIYYLNRFEPRAKFIINMPSTQNFGRGNSSLYFKTYTYLFNILTKSGIIFEVIEPTTRKIFINNFYIYKRSINDVYIGHNLDLPKQLISRISNNPNPEKIILLGTDENNHTEEDIKKILVERFSITEEELALYNVEYHNSGKITNFKEMLAYMKNVKVAIVLDWSTMIPFLLFMPKGTTIITTKLYSGPDVVHGWQPTLHNPIFAQFMKTIVMTDNLKKILDVI